MMELFGNYEIEEKIEEKKLANDTIEYNKFGFKFDPSKVLKFLLMTNINNIEYWYVLMTNGQQTNESILCCDEKINAWYSAFYEVRENHFLASVSEFNKLRAEALAKMPKRVEFEIKVTNCFDGISEKVKHMVLGSDNMTILNEKLAELDLEHNSTLTVTIMEIKQ